MPTVRRASLLDLDVAAPLFDAYRQFYGRPSDLTAARAFLAERLSRDESVVLLAFVDDRPAGLAQLYRTFTSVSLGRVTILNDLYVAPDARRAGVARALIAESAAVARRDGALRLELSTAHTNAAAIALYRSLGFVADDAYLHMSLTLG